MKSANDRSSVPGRFSSISCDQLDAASRISIQSGMRAPARFLLAATITLCLLSVADADELVLRDVSIVAIDDGSIASHQTVVIRGGTIISVSNEPAGASE